MGGGRFLDVALVVLAATGCQSVFGLDEPVHGDARASDTNTSSDAGVEVDALSCYGTGIVSACFDAPPTGPVTLVDQTINTDTSPLCVAHKSPAGAPWCVIVAGSMTVAGTVVVGGSRPLVLISTSSISVVGVLDVASHRVPDRIGPAGDSAACIAGVAPLAQSDEGAGGYGGTFGSRGGNGGPHGSGSGGGVASAVGAPPTVLRGGCPGSDGADTSAGLRGHGGGAVFLIGSTISVTGTINASGSSGGGAAGASFAGGGGGGSGGMIGLDAAMISVVGTGSVFANGGGGGEGSGDNDGVPGSDPLNATVAAVGGSGGTNSGGDGGGGAAGTGDGMIGGADAGTSGGSGGGGGGGGGGVVLMYGARNLQGPVSPPPL